MESTRNVREMDCFHKSLIVSLQAGYSSFAIESSSMSPFCTRNNPNFDVSFQSQVGACHTNLAHIAVNGRKQWHVSSLRQIRHNESYKSRSMSTGVRVRDKLKI